METFKEQKYHIDYVPATADDIIGKAKTIDTIFAKQNIHTTSIAARILRNNGFTVGYIDEIKEFEAKDY